MVARNDKAIMPVTLNLKNAMIDCGINSSNYIIVPNVVDQIFFNSAITPLRTEPARIIHVSTFEDRSKNISGIIDAVGELKNIRVDFKMVFVGDGVDFEAMKAKTIEKNLSEFIEFTGFTSLRQQVFSLLIVITKTCLLLSTKPLPLVFLCCQPG